jgi:hypothetical protein
MRPPTMRIISPTPSPSLQDGSREISAGARLHKEKVWEKTNLVDEVIGDVIHLPEHLISAGNRRS